MFEKVAKRFKENYYFYADDRRDGVVLYKKGNTELPEPETLTIAKQLEISKKYLKTWFELLIKFLGQQTLLVSYSKADTRLNYSSEI
jgi:hypothetical protein